MSDDDRNWRQESESENDSASVASPHPALDVLPILAAPVFLSKGKNTIREDLVTVACWRLNNVRFAFGSSFLLPATRKEFERLSRLKASHPGAPLAIFAHADPVGDDAFNKQLSGHRAAAVYGVLVRDPARWEKLYSSGGSSEGWGSSSIHTMLAALGFDSGSSQAIHDFQSKNGLSPDGVAGPKTREKLFTLYMEYLYPAKAEKSEFLARGADSGGKGDYMGCSEFNPFMVFSTEEQRRLSKKENHGERDSQNEVNRRVLILFFRPGTVVTPSKWPCPRAEEAPDACRKRFWSNGESRRSPQQARREFTVTHDTFACRFYHRLVKESPCEGGAASESDFQFSV